MTQPPDDPARKAAAAIKYAVNWEGPRSNPYDLNALKHAFKAGWAECAKQSAREIEGWKNGYANLITENDRIKNSLRAQVACLREGLEAAREDIETGIGDRFFQMGKEYLTKEYVESSSMLKLIDQALARAKELEGANG